MSTISESGTSVSAVFLYARCRKTIQIYDGKQDKNRNISFRNLIILHNSRSLANLINNYYLVTSCSNKNRNHNPYCNEDSCCCRI